MVYFGDTDAETAIALRQPTLAEDIARLTGLPVERRAEGSCSSTPRGTSPTSGSPAAAERSTVPLG
ncbi:hypothetical protein NKH18_47675 [Streptomyces sp. M10(2022)]